MNQSKEMVKIAYNAMDDKLAKDIKIIDIHNISVVSDYFLIGSGTNPNQVRAIADNVEELLHKAGYPIKGKEGYSSSKWILMDYNDIIVHVFSEEDRSFYDLERIWKDGKEITIEELESNQN